MMRFTIILSSAPNSELRFTDWQFEGGGFVQKLRFPLPGTTISQEVSPTENRFTLSVAPLDAKPLRFHNLNSSDQLGLIYLPNNIVLGSIFHVVPRTDCMVECPDGKSSQTCITCYVESLKVRICC